METNLQVYAVHDAKPWGSRAVDRCLDAVAPWEASLGMTATLEVPGMTGNAVLEVRAVFMGS